jgi:hypothetical protein
MEREKTINKMRGAIAISASKNSPKNQAKSEFFAFMSIMHPEKTDDEIRNLADCMEF